MDIKKIDRMIELQTAIDALTAELEPLKEEARVEANGVKVAFPGTRGAVIVAMPRTISEQFDYKAWKVTSPAAYAKAFAKHHTAPRVCKANVNIAKNV